MGCLSPKWWLECRASAAFFRLQLAHLDLMPEEPTLNQKLTMEGLSSSRKAVGCSL